jgi:hypothetical protein
MSTYLGKRMSTTSGKEQKTVNRIQEKTSGHLVKVKMVIFKVKNEE